MSRERILVVDDDREFAASIALHCRELGYETQIASTPLAAIASMVAHPPDLLCLDVNLPTGNGLDLCQFLVRESDRRHVPVVVLTGQSDRETVFRSAQLGARYLHKSPDLWQRLQPTIEELLPQPST